MLKSTKIGAIITLIAMIMSSFWTGYDILAEVLSGTLSLSVLIPAMFSFLVIVYSSLIISSKKNNFKLTLMNFVFCILSFAIPWILAFLYLEGSVIGCGFVLNTGFYFLALIGGAISFVTSFYEKRKN